MSSRQPTKRARPVEAEPPKRRLGVVVVDPLPVIRAGLSMLVEDRPDMEVLAEAGTSDEALVLMGKVRRTRVVVLVGLGLDGRHDSFWLIRTLRERYPAVAIVGCGANAEAMSISRALFMGADGYVDKSVDPVEFLRCIRQASEGEMVLAGPPMEWVGVIADGIDRQREIETRLTEREREVLVVAAEGLTAREIAARLGVAERTITTHLGRIYEKLGVSGRIAAIRQAASAGLVTVGSRE